MVRMLHKAAGYLGFGLIAAFFVSTIVVETMGDPAQIALVKRGIFYTIFLLVPVMAAAALTGRALAKSRHPDETAARKKRRTPLIGLNAVFILIPLAVALHRLAEAGDFGGLFYLLQGAELGFGALNLFWLSRNIRDGKRLALRR